MLAQHFVAAFAERNSTAAGLLTADALDRLAGHGWAGNVRELRNVCETACTLASGDPITAASIDRLIREADAPETEPMSGRLEDTERRAILKALEENRWNRAAAAKQLDIALSTLYEKIRRYGLTPPG